MEKAFEEEIEDVWISLHYVVRGIRHSKELRFSSLVKSVGLNDPIGSFRSTEVTVSKRNTDREMLHVEEIFGAAQRLVCILREFVDLDVHNVKWAQLFVSDLFVVSKCFNKVDRAVSLIDCLCSFLENFSSLLFR